MNGDLPSASTLDAVRWMPPLTPIVSVANADFRPALATSGSLLIAPAPNPKRVTHKATPHKRPLPQGAWDIIKARSLTRDITIYFDNVFQTPDVPARAMLAKRVKSIPGLAHYTAQDVCSWFATARRKQRRRERANLLVRARELPPQASREESREQVKKGGAVDAKPNCAYSHPTHILYSVVLTASGWACSGDSEDIMPSDIRAVLLTQLTELMREDPNPSSEVAQS
ncbi:hypothetical protein BD309DRAFT_1022904 [Dichomitus squalens]|nr:hypothetical protein BD309DRAFT_1022904 [Dichomitus squalens]